MDRGLAGADAQGIDAVECIRDRLIDRHRNRLRRRIDVVARMQGKRLVSHAATSGTGETSRLISPTTKSISDSVVRMLVTHARMTGGPPPRRTSDIHAICRSWRSARNRATSSPSRLKQTTGSGVRL